MISALLQYAEDRGLVSKPGYAKKAVKWILEFNEKGNKYIGLVPSDREFFFAPDLSQGELKTLGAQRGMGSHFLIERIGVFLGWGKDEKDEYIMCKRRETLVWMLDQAGRYDQTMKAVARCLLDTSISEMMRREAIRYKTTVKPQDAVTIRLGGRFPVEESSWHEWWDHFRTMLKKPESGQILMRCFGTGELVTPVLTHPKLKKLTGVGLSQPHAPIVTFDKEAFESYGLTQGMNAAMDMETASAYVNAIDHLLESSVIYSWKRPKKGAARELITDYAKLGGARIAYWYIGPVQARKEVEEHNDYIGLILGSSDKEKKPPDDPEEERILAESRLRLAIDSIRSGTNALTVGGVRFCILALSGAGGRVMIRDFIEGTVLQLAAATEKWFKDLSLNTYWGEAGYPPSLEQILTAPLAKKRSDQEYPKWAALSGIWRQALWRSALTGGKLPDTAFIRALIAHNSAVVRGDLTDEDKGGEAQRRSRLRLALVKAYLLRKGVNMQPALDPEHPSAAYHCGRLLAVYDSLQRAALGNVGAGVVQRFYGGALTNPSGVFGQLSRMAQTHLSKLEGGLTYFFTERIAEIHNGIAKRDSLPAQYPSALDMEGQALFALGFWHQTAFDNKNRADAKAKKTEHGKTITDKPTHEEDDDE
jgi:CRISPR-associated protein Csd1